MKNIANRYYKFFTDTSKAINSGLNLLNILNLIIENLITGLNIKACTVFHWDRQKSILEIIATRGLSESYLKKGPVDPDKSIAETLKGTAAMIYDTLNDPRLEYPDEAKEEGIASILSVPISVEGQIMGVLRIYTSERRSFTNEDYEFIVGLADMAGIAIDNSRMNGHLKVGYERMVD